MAPQNLLTVSNTVEIRGGGRGAGLNSLERRWTPKAQRLFHGPPTSSTHRCLRALAEDASPSASSTEGDASSSGPRPLEATVELEADELGARREALSRLSSATELNVSGSEAAAGEGGGGLENGGSLKGMLLLNLGAALFGSNQVVIKQAEELMAPHQLSALRFVIAAAVFLPQIVKGMRNPRVRSASAELAVWLFGGYTAQAQGLAITTAARGAFTGTFTVLAVPILVGLSGRKIASSTWVAAAIAIAGVGLLTTSGGEPNIGDAWCILSAILFGVHKFRSESITSCNGETTELVGVQIALVALMSSVLCVPDMYSCLHQGNLDSALEFLAGLPWVALAFMGIGTTALTLYCEMEAMKEVSAPLAALIYSAEPLWGALFAWWLGGERWGGLGWVGAGLIVASSVYSQVSGDDQEAKTQVCPAVTEDMSPDALPDVAESVGWESIAADVVEDSSKSRVNMSKEKCN